LLDELRSKNEKVDPNELLILSYERSITRINRPK